MLTTRIIPCLDVKDGRIVKGVRFQNLRDAGSPTEQARLYETQGADEIVLLDVGATPDGRSTQLDIVASVRVALSIPLTVGGGVRRVEDAHALLDAGADKVAVNSAAVRNPELVQRLSERFGRQCVVVAIDARRSPDARSWEVVIQSGSQACDLDALEWAKRAGELGAGEILLTSWDRDGVGEGYDIELIRAVRKVVNVPIIASGGAADPEDMKQAIDAGADAVLAASIFHDGRFSVREVKAHLAGRRVEVRLS